MKNFEIAEHSARFGYLHAMCSYDEFERIKNRTIKHNGQSYRIVGGKDWPNCEVRVLLAPLND